MAVAQHSIKTCLFSIPFCSRVYFILWPHSFASASPGPSLNAANPDGRKKSKGPHAFG